MSSTKVCIFGTDKSYTALKLRDIPLNGMESLSIVIDFFKKDNCQYWLYNNSKQKELNIISLHGLSGIIVLFQNTEDIDNILNNVRKVKDFGDMPILFLVDEKVDLSNKISEFTSKIIIIEFNFDLKQSNILTDFLNNELKIQKPITETPTIRLGDNVNPNQGGCC